MSEDFFSRWSRRKQEASAPAQSPPPIPICAEPPGSPPQTAQAKVAGEPPKSKADIPLPTLEDVQQLTSTSDFQPYMQHGVGVEVRNAAMKKLFTDPHFNVMDGLDIYIDDYSRPDPLPAGMLRKMVSAQFLRSVSGTMQEKDGCPTQDPTDTTEPEQAPQFVAQLPNSSATAGHPRHDDDPDLQLQPDPDPADPATGSRPR